MEITNIQFALCTLIERFIERQSLVLEAMRDLRPDLIMRHENRDKSEFWAQWTPERWQAFVIKHVRDTPNPGEWGENEEWAYFLHGSGCRLTHKVTQERIQWDLGSLHTFNKNWFVDYLAWLLDQNVGDEPVDIVRVWYEDYNALRTDYKPVPYNLALESAVFPVLEQLHRLGFLSQREGDSITYTWERRFR